MRTAFVPRCRAAIVPLGHREEPAAPSWPPKARSDVCRASGKSGYGQACPWWGCPCWGLVRTLLGVPQPVHISAEPR